MKRFKLILTENQVRILKMALQEAEDANSYQDTSPSYRGILRDLARLSASIYKQLAKQRCGA